MDEKEKENISNRARDFELSKPLASPHLSYSKGALDQDPISCKKRTEEILKIIEGYIEFYKDENKHPHTRITLEDITTVIEALP